MSLSHQGLTPRLRPLSSRKSATLSVLDIGTSKVVCIVAELQPVESFWALVREAVANDTFDRLADLRRRVTRRCRRLADDRETVLGAIGFHWAVNLEA